MVVEHALWIEKYRPQSLEDFFGQEIIKARVKAMLEQKSIPHLLFAGPAGVGKSTLALIIAKSLFGEGWRDNFLELNASVTPETPILVKKNKKIKRVTFGELASESFNDNTSKYKELNGVEILSLNKENKVCFMPVKNISRHKVSKVVEFKYEGGSVRTSLNHSLMVIDGEGLIVSKRAEYLKKGDLVISFRTSFEGKSTVLNFSDYAPQEFNELVSGLVKNPKLKTVLEDQEITPELSWLFGLYLAEGCTGFSRQTSGQTIFTLGYPQESHIASNVQALLQKQLSLDSFTKLGASGFNRKNLSSIQVRTCNTQLARFMGDNFYEEKAVRNYALTKRVPDFIFSSTLNDRHAFLKGYMGDAYGEWSDYVRYSSRSKAALIDVTWLGKLSGIESSYFETEARLVWKKDSSFYAFSDLLPASPFMNFLESIKPGYNYKYLLRHQYYHKKSKRLSKSLALEALEKIQVSLSDSQKKRLELLKGLMNSDLYTVEIKDVKVTDYNDYVYDVSVPNSEVFWGGTSPILLHNSDARGIDVIRNEVKSFARTRSLSGDFKIIFLDECDALTREAQQALRRTMEMYASSTRFIMSCNYVSKIIDPIMSRCTVFRFKPIDDESLKKVIDGVVSAEGLKLDDSARNALLKVSRGDVRKVQNVLQSCASLNKTVSSHMVFEIVAGAHPEEIREIISSALKKEFIKSRQQLQKVMVSFGLSGLEVIKQISEEIWALSIDDKIKAKLIEFCGDAEFRMVEGADEFLQLEAFLARVVSL